MTREYPASRKPTRRRRLFAAAVVIAALSLVSIAAMPERLGTLVAPPAGSGDKRNASSEESVDQNYLRELDPYLAVVVGEGNRLSEMGQSRSRNILELSVRMDRFREASANLLAHLEANPPPAGLESFVAGLRTHLAAAETSIDSSIGAIQGFDWDALGVAVSTFSDAVEAIEGLSGRYVQ